MTQIYVLLRELVPELIELYEKRYTILRSIHSMQPIGRRSLASALGMGERIVRNETTFLKDAGFLHMSPSGMIVTPEGEMLLEGLREFSRQLKGLYELEEEVAKLLRVKKVIVVPGSVDDDGTIMHELGKTAAAYLKSILKKNSVIAVTGGTTVRSVASALPPCTEETEIIVIPARGGMGSNVENQSNTIASIFAKKLRGTYHLLHVPDQLGARAAETLLNEPDIKSIIQWLKRADILIYGIGKAQDMAQRRNLPPAQLEAIQKAGAVAEAFGYYFNRNGEVVFASNSILMSHMDLMKIPYPLGVAGGKHKAEAIMAVAGILENSVLVIDEGAAKEIINISRKSSSGTT